MSCEDDVCGTGGWTGPLPGDPDNNVTLAATPAFGGIDVSWSYPTTNPFAVAHTILYRAPIADFSAAIVIAVASGNFFYDKQDNSSTYYYWIRIVSVNGTEGALVGPASATARPTIDLTIQQLTGKIDAGLLATSLRTEIDKITTNYGELTTEINNRISANSALTAAFADVQSGVTQSLAFINTEITTRQEGQNALAIQVNAVAAANIINAAGIIDERTARVTALAAEATRVNSTFATTTALTAAMVTTRENARTDTTTAIADYAVRVDATFLTNAAVVLQDAKTYVDVNAARASDMTTVQSSLYGNTAGGQVGLTTTVTSLNGKVTDIGALYTAKVNVNGLIGGFGIYNNGTEVDAGFDVDTFWVGRTGANKKKPFIIATNPQTGLQETFIDDAVINKLTFSKLRDESGSFIVENGKVKANYLQVTQITGGSYTSYNWPSPGLTGFYLGPGGFLMGNANNGKYVQITDAGDMYLPGLRFINGVMTLDALNVVKTLNIAGNSVTVPASISGGNPGGTFTPGMTMLEVGSTQLIFNDVVRLSGIANWTVGTVSGGTNTKIEVRVYNASNTYIGNVLANSLSVPNNLTSSHSAAGLATLGGGTYTFRVFFGNDWVSGSYYMNSWNVLLIGTMR